MPLIHDPKLKLLGGKAGRIVHPKDLSLTQVVDLTEAWPKVPATVDFTTKFAMYGNDKYGDCTCAGAGNLSRAATGGKLKLSSQAVLAAYRKLSPQDTGCYEATVLEYWRTTGFGKHRITAHANVSPTIPWLKTALYLFGGVYLGVALPTAAQSQEVWDAGTGPSYEPGSWGYHCLILVGMDEQGATLATWGMKQRCTFAWLTKYVTEAHAVILPEYAARDLHGFNATRLNSYLSILNS